VGAKWEQSARDGGGAKWGWLRESEKLTIRSAAGDARSALCGAGPPSPARGNRRNATRTAGDRPRALHQAAGNHTRGWEQRSAGERRIEREAAAAAEAEQHGGGALATAIGEEAIDCSAAAERNTAARHCDGTAGGLEVGLTGRRAGAQRARGRRYRKRRVPPRAAEAGQRHMAYSGYSHRTLWVLRIAHAGYSWVLPQPGDSRRTCAVSPSHRDKR